MNSNKSTHYIVRMVLVRGAARGPATFVYGGPDASPYHMAWARGSSGGSYDNTEPTRFATIEEAKAVRRFLARRYAPSYRIDIVKVTETTTPGQVVRREVPLGTTGSKVAIVHGGDGRYFHNDRGVDPIAAPIDNAALFSNARAALRALQIRVSRNGLWHFDADLVGILEETAAPTVTRTEDIVPEPVEPNFTRRVTIVGSSVIKEVAYAPAEKVLEVVFNDGKAYRYGGVPEWIIGDLAFVKSVGSYYTTYIRNQFPRVDTV